VSVRAYYERNTRLFLALGLGRQARSIHRAVWAEGAASYDEALGYVNRLILRAIQGVGGRGDVGIIRVLDVGCGVGGTLFDLIGHAGPGLHGVGLTISRTQVRLARRHALAHGIAERCLFVEGDYLDIPCGPGFDLAFAVESLAHAPDLGRALRQVAGALRPGGRLVICDDVLAPGRLQGEREASWVAAFRRGWYVPGITTASEVVALVEAAGLRLVEQRDLTPHLRLVRLPDALVDIILRAGERLPGRHLFLQSALGGLALQHCLGRGVIQYQWLVFEKPW
jgi:SAM-dependent methyltransferase